MKISILLPVYNQVETVRKCIESLLQLDWSDKEIIVVDDGSTDGTASAISQYPVQLIKLEKRRHRSNALNIGLRYASGDIITITEGDAVYDRNYLREAVKLFEDNRVVGVVGRLIPANMNKILPRIKRVEQVLARGKDEAEYQPFTAWILRKSIIDMVGGFDEDVYVHDDVALGIKIRELGYKLAYARNAVFYHYEKESVTDIFKQQFRWGVGFLPFYRKYGWLLSVKKNVFVFYSVVFLMLGVLPLLLKFMTFLIWPFLFCLFCGASYYTLQTYRKTKDVYSVLLLPYRLIHIIAFNFGLIWGIFLLLLKRDFLRYT